MAERSSSVPFSDPRYVVETTIATTDDRTVLRAHDRLLDRPVILKHDVPIAIRHEYASLATLPPGTAPRPLDLFVDGTGREWLAMSVANGDGLGDAAATVDERVLPIWFVAILDQLLHAHRTGIVHGDLKPSNILVDQPVGAGTPPAVTLLDFGSCRWNSAYMTREEYDLLGATPPFTAPEIVKGWAVDARADQYSLGVTWRTLFPHAAEQAEWSALLDRMCEARPSRRFADLRAARDDVTAAFGSVVSVRERPRLGGGPLRGRREDLARIDRRLDASEKSARLLLKAQPDIGLSRVLAESTVRRFHRGKPLRSIDLGRGGSHDPAVLDELLQSTQTDILLGIGDAASASEWKPDRLAARLSPGASGFDPLTLPPLEPWFVSECVVQAMGSPSVGAKVLGDDLAKRFESRWDPARRAFDAVVDAEATAKSAAWALPDDPAPFRHSHAVRGDVVPDPTTLLPTAREALALVAEAGDRVKRRTAERLIEAFSKKHVLDELLDGGYLQPVDDRLHFPTTAVRQAARPEEVDPRVDEWLNQHVTPDPGDVDGVIDACHRARRHGDRARESSLLAEATEHNFDAKAFAALRRLISYPGSERTVWTIDHARRTVLAFRDRVGDPFDVQRVSHHLGIALSDDAPDVAEELFQDAANGPRYRWAAGAVYVLLRRRFNLGKLDECDPLLARLDDLEASEEADFVGLASLHRAWRAFMAGKRDEAESFATTAANELRETPLALEGATSLAIVLSQRDPSRAIEVLEAATKLDLNHVDGVYLHGNFANLLLTQGRLARARSAVAKAIEYQNPIYATETSIQLSAVEASIVLYLDDYEQAPDLLDHLAAFLAVADRPDEHVTINFLLGLHALQAGAGRQALALLRRAAITARDECAADRQAVAFDHLVTAVNDLDADDFRQSERELFEHKIAGDAPLIRAVRARMEATIAESAGDLEGAIDLLNDPCKSAREIPDPEVVGRLHVHRGRLHLLRGDLDEAERAIVEGEAAYPDEGYGYAKAYAWMLRSTTQRRRGRMNESDEWLEKVIDIARRNGFGGLLADALKRRAESRLQDGEA